MIRVAILDPHAAVRAGLQAALDAQPDLAGVGVAAGTRDLWPLLHHTHPRVLLLGHDPARGDDSFALTLRLRSRPLAPHVVICAQEPEADLVVPATLAGAHAVVDAGAGLHEVLHAVRAAADDIPLLPMLTPFLQTRAARRLAPADRAIFAMRLAGTSTPDIAATTGLSPAEVHGRTLAILTALSRTEDLPALPVALGDAA